MPNGSMGKKIGESTRLRVLELLSKGNTTSQVAQRLGISTAFVRRFQRDEEERQAIDQQVPDDINQESQESI